MPAAPAQNPWPTDSVMTASPAELIVLLYERLELDLARARTALESQPASLEGAHQALLHAQDVVMALGASLRTDAWEAADGLLAIYEWLGHRALDGQGVAPPSVLGTDIPGAGGLGPLPPELADRAIALLRRCRHLELEVEARRSLIARHLGGGDASRTPACYIDTSA